MKKGLEVVVVGWLSVVRADPYVSTLCVPVCVYTMSGGWLKQGSFVHAPTVILMPSNFNHNQRIKIYFIPCDSRTAAV